jgi:dCTP deaminase
VISAGPIAIVPCTIGSKLRNCAKHRDQRNVILSGQEIAAARQRGEIEIEPFCTAQLNPNSYDFCLAPKIIEISPEADQPVEIDVGPDGHLLLPGRLYLGCTAEVIGSANYATTLLGRSSIGRLGLFLNITADLGHCGASSQWTLEMTVVQPLRIYAGMRIGQVAFWTQLGKPTSYSGRYHRDLGPQLNRDRPLSAGLNDDSQRQ